MSLPAVAASEHAPEQRQARASERGCERVASDAGRDELPAGPDRPSELFDLLGPLPAVEELLPLRQRRRDWAARLARVHAVDVLRCPRCSGRMEVLAAAVGKLCSTLSTTSQDLGGPDRFLLPSEQTIFAACINNPPGYEGGNDYGLVNAKEAVTGHLPRAAIDLTKIRTGAKLVIIVATDEVPQSLASIVGVATGTCSLPAATQTALDIALQPYLQLFNGSTDPEATAQLHVIGGVCGNGCSTDVAHGYKELAQHLGGQVGDVCQSDLGNTLQVVIDSIVARASPLGLQHVPISATLAMALDGVEVKRSRTNGFDLRSTANGAVLVLVNVKCKKGSLVVASYRRWQDLL